MGCSSDTKVERGPKRLRISEPDLAFLLEETGYPNSPSTTHLSEPPPAQLFYVLDCRKDEKKRLEKILIGR